MEFFNDWTHGQPPCAEIDQMAQSLESWGRTIPSIRGIFLSLDNEWPLIDIELVENQSLLCVQEFGLMIQELLELPVYWISVSPYNIVFLIGAMIVPGEGFDEALEYQMEPWEHIAAPIETLQIRR